MLFRSKAFDAIAPKLDNESAWLLREILDNFSIDVSYMSDEEFSRCMDDKFNSVEYYEKVDEDMKTGQKFMAKSVDIGDQVSQNVGVFYPTTIDNYVTIVRGFRRYGRYMDDMYMIHEDRAYLEETIENVCRIAKENGLFINENKTHIERLSGKYTFLKMKYSLSDSGKVVKRISPQAVVREKRRLKAYHRLLDRDAISYYAIEQAYKSWMGRYAKVMSKDQRKSMQKLYENLFDRRSPKWKS